ncbi:MAG TPA: hypothetical protein VJ865_16020 [Gemmatimonadaceae bacterium]|nr:hypothetical protein [Gemmatimonadaceae bacterium]
MTHSAAFTDFVRSIPLFDSLHRTEQARYFVYFLTTDTPDSAATPSQVARCFREAEITPWDDVRFYLRDAASNRNKRESRLLIHTGSGYRLERKERERIRLTLSTEPHRQDTDKALRSLVGQLSAAVEQSFLDEAVKCFEVSAYRAAIVMTWNLTLYHLREFVSKHHLAAFNGALSKNTDKRVKVTVISSLDDFSDIPENKFIELLRSANIISNDVRKILEEKLGTRNSYAHPSTLVLSPVKASDFIQDLVNNVVLKYKLN